MKGERPLSDFIRINGLYQSTPKLSGEMHAGCFMYQTSWNYIRFMKGTETIHVFNSNYDLALLDTIREKIKTPNLKLIAHNRFFNITKENWEDGTFSFDGVFSDKEPSRFYGHFRQDFISQENELILIGQNGFTDIYKFVELKDNLRLELEILNLFSDNKFVKVNDGLPSFGYTDIENAFAFDKLQSSGYIEPSGSHHLDCYDFFRTAEGDKYFQSLKGQLSK